MPTFLRQFNALSFWLGFIAGLLFLWLLGRLRPALRRMRENMQAQSQTARKEKLTGDEIRIGNDMMRLAQGWHLAAPLFSLDEILVAPRLLAPEAAPDAYERPNWEDVTDWCIPYLADWPELGSFYGAPYMSLGEAMQGGTNLVVTGQPGSGKSVTLAHFATQIIRGAKEIGNLAGYVPLLLHAADLALPPRNPESPLDPILEAISGSITSVRAKRLPRAIQSLFVQGRAVLLIDGMDELPPALIAEISQYLSSLLAKYPNLRIVATAAADVVDGLAAAGFMPITMAAWSETQRAAFIRQWSSLWERYVASAAKAEERHADPWLIIGWLVNNTANLTPFELTMKVWAAFAGDALGATPLDAIEAYLKRMMHNQPHKNRAAIEQLASQMTLAMQSMVERRSAERWLGGTDVSLPESEPRGAAGETPTGKEKPVRARGALPDLIECGLIIPHITERITIVHPALGGYLASLALLPLNGAEQLAKQVAWTGRDAALQYLANQDRQGDWINILVKDESEELTLRGLLKTARWLRNTPENSPWTLHVMRKLASTIQEERLPLKLRGRALTALATSGNSGLPVLMRQMMASTLPGVRQLGVLGCGLLRDVKAVGEISKLIDDHSHGVSRAAILALVAIGEKTGMETVAYALLQGDETLRRAAAEALTNDPEEGYPTLEEASGLEDPSVRKAAAFGLGRSRQSWAVEILEKMRTSDTQWIVQDAATQVLDNIQNPNPRLPSHVPPLTHTPWLIAFAGERGMGVAPGKPAYELLYQALRQGKEDQQLAAIFFLGQNGNESSVMPLYESYFSKVGEVRESAFSALWNLASAGITLPPPMQYNLRI